MTSDPVRRNELFKMARDWMAVAMHEEQQDENALDLA
jgi:hypothetical protein